MKISTDIETYEMQNGELKPVLNSRQYTLGVIYTEDNQYFSFSDSEKHWQWIIDKGAELQKQNKKLYVYGHNHQYDFLGYAKNHLTDKKLKRFNSFPLFYVYENIYFIDTMSFFKQSLEKTGIDLRIPKKEMPQTLKSRAELLDYCKQDCFITLEAINYLQKTLKELGYSPRKLLTAGQVAMTTFLSYARRKNIHWHFMKNGEVYRSPNFRQTRVALRGGRVEAFKTGTFKSVSLLDINSMYPYIMASMRFPDLREPLFLKRPPLSQWENIKTCLGTIQCTIECDLKVLPLLPIRYDKKQFYPKKGKFTGTWTICEIKKALELGYRLRSIKWCELYKISKVNPFTEYINDLYQLRLNKPELKNTIKLLMNNLYGKFSQYRQNTDQVFVYRDEKQKYTKRGYQVSAVCEEYFLMEKNIGEYIPKYSNPLISTLITANARNYLYDLLTKIPQKDLLYTATDSIMFKGNHLEQYSLTLKLGDLHLVYQDAKAIILGEQKYMIDNKVAISGLPKQYLTEDVFKKQSIPMKRMVTFKDALFRGDLSLAGTFEEHNLVLERSSKQDTQLPYLIDETKDYYTIGEKND